MTPSAQSKRILVTGASGFIGSHLTSALIAKGYRVVPHSRWSGDIASCELDFDDVGHVFHLAARTFVPESWNNPLSYYRVNLLGTVNVLEFCRAHNASLTLMSSYVYGRPARLPISEDEPLQAFNPYSHTKILAEEASRYYQEQFHVPVTIIRPFNIYGPGQDRRFLIPKILTQAVNPQLGSIVVSDLRPRRDFIFVSDLVDLLIRTAFRSQGGVFNAGSGSSFSVNEAIEIVNAWLPAPKQVLAEGSMRPDEVFDVVADISRTREEFDWNPRTAFRDGLRETLDGVMSQLSTFPFRQTT
ncbi:MAG TPA: NAD(P)-dependent oxidoreductase [Chthoniobacterales bacterium]|jgi:nucleoside-diphosphate-sugar epimerase|nr:NAD(P)-dependent oxidoreductase [Chthoniobacterales bacterium]